MRRHLAAASMDRHGPARYRLERLLLERDLPELALGLLLLDFLAELLLERDLPELALGLLLLDFLVELLLERDLPELALARLPEDLLDEDLLPEDLPLLELFASPLSARSLFTVRAAISSARPFWPRFS
ncbi:MAG: hypothetical protein ACO1OY_00790 [Ramlibacter sp.]